MRTKVLFESPKGRDHSEDISLGGRKILKWMLGNRVRGCGLDSSASELGPVTGSCEHGNEPLGSIKSEEFLD
jgi:hypothetical protein